MELLSVDDEPLNTFAMARLIEEFGDDYHLDCCHSGKMALEMIKQTSYDVIFLDLNLGDSTGIDIAREINNRQQSTNLIIITGRIDCPADSIAEIYPSDFIIKPITMEKLLKAFAHLRFPVEIKHTLLRIQTFGSFEIFYDNIPLKFSYSKSKELLAYLIDRNGALCTRQEIATALWEDDDFNSHEAYYKKITMDLINVLRSVHCEDIIVRTKGKIGILPQMIQCDYFDYLNSEEEVINSYRGEYMSQYSWAEYTHGYLE